MSTGFPHSLDNYVNPNATDSVNNPSHSQQHTNANDAIKAIQEKIGVDGSTNPNSLDYKIAHLVSNTADLVTLLGVAGNNDQNVTGIENKTALDTFDGNVFSYVKYYIQISHNNSYYTSEISLVQDGTDFNLLETNIVSNTDTVMANIGFERNGSIISLTVTPVISSVNARYYRNALKK